MNVIEEKAEVLTRGVLKVQEEDLKSVLGKLEITEEEAKDVLRVIYFSPNSAHDIEYQIINNNPLEVYVHRKIDFNLFTNIGRDCD